MLVSSWLGTPPIVLKGPFRSVVPAAKSIAEARPLKSPASMAAVGVEVFVSVEFQMILVPW